MEKWRNFTHSYYTGILNQLFTLGTRAQSLKEVVPLEYTSEV